MLFHLYILSIQGEANGIFTTVLQQMDHRLIGAIEKDEEEIKKTLREDHKKKLISKHFPRENPSRNTSTVDYLYTPSAMRQRLYASGFPIKVGSYEIIDAFVCLGSRFKLSPLDVYVELCRSDMGGRRYWANIYYVADSEIPAAIIRIDECNIPLDTNEILEQIERDREYATRLKDQSRQFYDEDRKHQEEPNN